MSQTPFPRAERRKVRRFQIACPVTVMRRARGRSSQSEQGHLRNIGINGACFQLGSPLAVGQVIVMYVHFQDPERGVTTVRFVSVVTRTQGARPYDIAVAFSRRGRFLRLQLAEARGLDNPTAPKEDSAPWIN